MKKIFLLTLVITVLAIFSFQTVTAQFPKIKIPKITEPKPQPTPSDTSQPTTNNNAQPSQPDNRNPAGTPQSGPSINKPSIQFFLQVHKGYKGDPETWSWTPMIDFRVNGPFSPGGALSVEYSLPGKSWKFDCSPQDIGPSNAWVGIRDCGQNPPDTEAVTYTGPVDFKINLKNELEGKSATLFSGKFKVEKFHEGVVDLPKFKNNFVYYVNYDWTLPIAYVYDDLVYNWEYAYPSNNTRVPNLYNSRLIAAFWFKGNIKDVRYSKYAAYLYYQGQMVAEDTQESTTCEVLNRPDSNQDSPNGYCRNVFNFSKAVLWDKNVASSIPGSYFPMYKNPGEYEIKVLRNGKLARTAKFTFGSDYQIVDTGIGKQNNLGTLRIVVPVQIIGDQDGIWDRNAYKTDAFFGNPLNAFVAP
jgi:hypothetical protein